MKKVLSRAVIVLLFILLALTFAEARRKSSDSSSKESTISGYVSDTVCAAKASTVGYVDCTSKCLVKGGQLVIIVDDSKAILTIDNPEIVKGHECHHVLITGDVNLQTSVIHIYSLRIL